jgi:hypothetical protein
MESGIIKSISPVNALSEPDLTALIQKESLPSGVVHKILYDTSPVESLVTCIKPFSSILVDSETESELFNVSEKDEVTNKENIIVNINLIMITLFSYC